MGAVKLTEKINMVVQLEPWDPEKVYDRMGLDNEYIDIMARPRTISEWMTIISPTHRKLIFGKTIDIKGNLSVRSISR